MAQSSESRGVDAVLNGFFDPAFEAPEKLLIPLMEGHPRMLPPQTTRIQDGRTMQVAFAAREGGVFSEAAFFAEHDFVLLPHESAVEDWRVDVAAPDPASDVMRTYLPEVEEIVRTRLLPGRKLELFQPPPMERGPGTANPFYGSGVHADYVLTADDMQQSIEAFTSPEIARGWRARYDMDDVAGYLVVNFWRPIGLDGPLRHMPLAVCEPSTVRREDLVTVGIRELTPTGQPTHQSSLRWHPDQRWVTYPGMTRDEVLVFTNFQCLKDDTDPSLHLCFHTAFEDPGTPPGAPERVSVEHRVQIMLLRD